MDIHFSCPNCQSKCSARREQIGQEGKCHKCGATILVSFPNRDVSFFKSYPKAETINKKRKRLGRVVWTLTAFIIFVILSSVGKELGRLAIRKHTNEHQPNKSEVYQADQIKTIFETISRDVNKQCPMQIDKYTKLLSTMVVDRKVTYFCELDFNLLARTGAIGLSELKESQKKLMITNFCTNPNVDLFKQYNVSIEYQYRDLDGKHLFNLDISKDACMGRKF
ncbi:MAG: hypothetical protein ACREOI_02260 [bacterium]